MATQLHGDTHAGVRRLIADEVSEVLTRQPGLAKAVAANTAQIVAAVAAAVVALPLTQQKRLKAKSADVADMIAAFARNDLPVERIIIPQPATVEKSKGSGFGELIDIEEGKRRLAEYATPMRVEEWAGPVAGPVELERDYGIRRSTLHAWQQRGAVIGLLKGERKHVFPLEQFVDGRPVEGISQVVAVVPSPRSGWLWLVQPSPLLGNKRPIDILKQGRIDKVVEAARTVYEYP
jgi:hypothetical protein